MSCDILNILRHFIIQFCRTISYAFLESIQAIARFSVWYCSRLGCVNLCKVTLLSLWILCGILSLPQGTTRVSLMSSKYLHLSVPLIFSKSSVGRFIIYFLVYFKVRKPTFLYYYLVGKSLPCCLKTSTFLPDLYHSFPISSLCRVALKIVV